MPEFMRDPGELLQEADSQMADPPALSDPPELVDPPSLGEPPPLDVPVVGDIDGDVPDDLLSGAMDGLSEADLAPLSQPEEDAPQPITAISIGDGFEQDEVGGAMTINMLDPEPSSQAVIPDPFATLQMQITGSSAVGAANNGPNSTTTEWTYSAKEVTVSVSAVGVVSFADVSGGVTLTNKLYNLREAGNRGIGTGEIFGNGVAWDDMDDVFEGFLRSAPSGLLASVTITTDASGGVVGLFQADNAVGGGCN